LAKRPMNIDGERLDHWVYIVPVARLCYIIFHVQRPIHRNDG
jgi:hypothetical protein